MAAEQHGLLPIIGLGVELPAHRRADGPRLLAERIGVLVQPVIGAERLLAALTIERAELESAHGEARRRLDQDAIEAVVAKTVTRLRRRLAALGLRYRLSPESPYTARAAGIDVVVSDRLAVAIGADTRK